MNSKRFTRRLQNHILDEVRRMKPETLKREVENCAELNSRNCGWIEYGLKGLITEVLTNEQKLRAARKNHSAAD